MSLEGARSLAQLSWGFQPLSQSPADLGFGQPHGHEGRGEQAKVNLSLNLEPQHGFERQRHNV